MRRTGTAVPFLRGADYDGATRGAAGNLRHIHLAAAGRVLGPCRGVGGDYILNLGRTV